MDEGRVECAHWTGLPGLPPPSAAAATAGAPPHLHIQEPHVVEQRRLGPRPVEQAVAAKEDDCVAWREDGERVVRAGGGPDGVWSDGLRRPPLAARGLQYNTV